MFVETHGLDQTGAEIAWLISKAGLACTHQKIMLRGSSGRSYPCVCEWPDRNVLFRRLPKRRVCGPMKSGAFRRSGSVPQALDRVVVSLTVYTSSVATMVRN